MEPEPTAAEIELIRKYDLTSKFALYLDRHLILPLLEFLTIKEFYPLDDILKAKFKLASETGLSEYALKCYYDLHPDMTEEDPIVNGIIEQQRSQEAKAKDLGQLTSSVMEILEKPEVVQSLKTDKTQNVEFLKENHGLTEEMINALFQFGRFQFDSGNYQGAADLLFHFRALSLDLSHNVAATWGKFAAEILTTEWKDALEELNKLRDQIESPLINDARLQLRYRTWLAHWALFPFFNHEQGRDFLCDLYLSPAYINTIQTTCPWLIRYLAVALILARNSSGMEGSGSINTYQKRIKELVKLSSLELYEYTDPIILFINALFIDFDFDHAQSLLVEADIVMRNDFFLTNFAADFVEYSKQLMAEAYCRIHQRIDVNRLAAKLDLTPDRVIQLVQNDAVNLNAKIDIKDGSILLSRFTPCIYQQIIDKTKSLTVATQDLVQLVTGKNNANANANANANSNANHSGTNAPPKNASQIVSAEAA